MFWSTFLDGYLDPSKSALVSTFKGLGSLVLATRRVIARVIDTIINRVITIPIRYDFVG